jgi:hypothetical protein
MSGVTKAHSICRQRMKLAQSIVQLSWQGSLVAHTQRHDDEVLGLPKA